MAYLTVPSLVWVGGGEIIYGLKGLQCAPLDADVRSHLSGPSAIQLLAAMKGSGTCILTRYETLV